MKRIFILNAFPRSGKDEMVKAITNYLSRKHNIKTYNISSVDRVKEAAHLLGWNGAKDLNNRNGLSDLKDLSDKYWDGPFKYMCKMIDSISEGFIFIHIREPEQIKRMVETFPEIKTITIDRKDSLKNITNHADQRINEYVYDYVLTNDETLYQFIIKSEKFIKGFLND